jgi:bidirectional [NiFe] hydrogenase diaphorase subunit
MGSYAAVVTPPSDDKRWRIVEGTMRRHGREPDALIEVLHTVQESFAYLDEPALRFVAQSLRLPLSKVYGVATFYHFFSLKPQGEHTCVVCTGTACYIKGAGTILKTLEEMAPLHPGETTLDNKVSLLTARCLGSCGLAPAVVFDGNVAGRVDYRTGPEPVSVAVGDFNRDSQTDLVIGHVDIDSLSILLNTAGTRVSLQSSSNPSHFGEDVTFTATVTATVHGRKSPTGTVVFKDGTTKLGKVTLIGGQASLTTSDLGVGKHHIIAVYSGDHTFNPNKSKRLTQEVLP